MSRTGARNRARKELTEAQALLTQAVSLLSKSRVVLKRSRSADAPECLAMVESFCSCQLPTHPNQHPDNLAVDQFAAAMKMKLAKGRARCRNGWDKPWVKDKQLAKLLVKNLPKGNSGNFEDIANFAMMLHRRGADPKEFTLAFNKSKPGWELIKRVTAQGDIENYLMIVTDATVYLSAYGLRDSGSADRDELQTQLEEAE